jgi:D-3-phosphoglycerate dehydrogenase
MARFRIGYIDRPMHEAFLEEPAKAAEVELLRLSLSDGDDRIRDGLATCDAYYVQAARDELPPAWHVTPALLATLPRLLVAASYGAGYDTIDVPACTAAGVAAVNQAGGNAEGVAEHAVGMMLSLLKRMPEAGIAIRQGRAQDRNPLMGRELHGRTVGVIGLGHTGGRVAEIVRLAFACRVLACDPFLTAEECARRGAEKVELDALLAASDVVSVHCPLDDTTRGMLGAAAFARMRQGAIVVTTARGGIHDEAALTEALFGGHLGGAGLDVWAPEPPATGHRLLAHPAVIATPHTAGVTHESRARIARMGAQAFLAVARGEVPPRLLNPAVADRLRQRLAARRASGGAA